MYSRIYKKENNNYQVRFLNKKTKKEDWHTYSNEKDALALANEIDVDYHLNNPNELPKGITLDKSNSRFRFHVWIEPNVQKHIISSKSLERVINSRSYMLKQIIGIL